MMLSSGLSLPLHQASKALIFSLLQDFNTNDAFPLLEVGDAGVEAIAINERCPRLHRRFWNLGPSLTNYGQMGVNAKMLCRFNLINQLERRHIVESSSATTTTSREPQL